MAADLYPAGDRRAARRAVDDRRASAGAARARRRRARSRIASCCATCATRLRATRAWIEASLDRPTASRRPPDGAYLDAAALREPLRLCYDSLVEHGQRRDRGRPAARPAAPRRGRSASRWRRSTSGRSPTATPRRSTPSPGAAGSARTPSGTRQRRLEFLMRELDKPAAADPAGLETSPGRAATCSTRSATIARIHPESLGAYVITMTHAGVGRPRRRAAAEGGSACRVRCASCRCSRPAPISQRRRRRARPAARDRLVSRRIDGRQEVMVGYSDSAKDVGPAHRRLGALQGAGSDRRRLPPARRQPSRCFTGAAAASAAAAARPIWRCSRSRPDRSTARCASPSRAR